jgi:hypothetical protein
VARLNSGARQQFVLAGVLIKAVSLTPLAVALIACSARPMCEAPSHEALASMARQAEDVDLSVYEPDVVQFGDAPAVLFRHKGEMHNGELLVPIDADFFVLFDACGRYIGTQGSI